MVERYETITLDEIKKVWTSCLNIMDITDEQGFIVAKQLTGFGSTSTCYLCHAVYEDCLSCVYGSFYGCINNDNNQTYLDIEQAKSPTQLKNAFRRRSKHLRKNYKHIFNDN